MKETELKIRILGDQVLRKKAQKVEKITDFHRKSLSEMARLMYSVSGVGLAAPQVGLLDLMFVADIGSGLYKLINPKIIKSKGSQVNEEGCLSIPGVGIKVKRAKNIVLQAQDETGKPVLIEAEELLAGVFQHDLDHLHGKLIVDYASPRDKINLRKNL
jgi:peptide deformylase